MDREEGAGHKACDRDGQSDLGLLQSELLLRPFLFLECLSPEVSRSCVWGCRWRGAPGTGVLRGC